MVKMLRSINLLFLLIIIILCLSCSRSYSPNEVVFVNNKAYRSDSITLLTGYIRNYYENGKLKSVKEYKNGLVHGYYLRLYENGQISLKMIYNQGNPLGFVQYYENGTIKAKTVHSGDLQFIIRYNEQGKLIQLETLKNLLLNGYTIKYYDNGRIESIIQYVDGKKHGLFCLFFPNGKLKAQCKFVNDSIDGIFKTWNEDGFYGEEIFKMGKRIGMWKYYYPSGKIHSTIVFHENGLVKERIEYDEKGNIIAKFTSNLNEI